MTAPQQTAPDGGEGIVAALNAAACACGGDAIRHTVGADRRCPVHGFATDVRWVDLRRHLAPTVARLIEDAVAERLAGVEALADEFRRLDYSWDGQTGEPLIPLSLLLAVLNADSEPYKAPESAEQASEAPGGQDESAGLSEVPHIDWARMYHGVCPKCREEKFVGHGPLCGDCYYEERA